MSLEARTWRGSRHQQSLATSQSATDLWRVYQAKPTDPTLRQQLILRYAPLVKYVAGRLAVFLPPAFDVEDLLGHGTVGLIEAVDRYDPSQGVKFETYAIRRIRGAMIDALRSFSMLPRGTVRQVRALDGAFADLEHELGRAPTMTEVAERLGTDESAVLNLLIAANFALFSLDTKIGGEDDDGLTLLDTLASDGDDPLSSVEKREVLALLAQAIDRLPDRERLVLSLYYEEELTLKEIGKVLRVSESRVSQLHSVAIARLRAALAPLRAEVAACQP